MNHTCTSNNLISFDYKTHSQETEIVVKFAEICLEELVKSHQMNLFCGGI